MIRASSRLVFGALCLVATAAIVLTAQGQTSDRDGRERWQYLQLVPSDSIQSVDANGPRGAFRACQPIGGQWSCREFAEGDRIDPLADALQTLGGEGWELVSATALPSESTPVVPYNRSLDPVRLTYVFKRQIGAR
jgi:hypothetical protein